MPIILSRSLESDSIVFPGNQKAELEKYRQRSFKPVEGATSEHEIRTEKWTCQFQDDGVSRGSGAGNEYIPTYNEIRLCKFYERHKYDEIFE